jgi:hypothetical protein
MENDHPGFGAASIVMSALSLAFTLRRTGDLRFAIGLHAAWDWAGSFFYGIPDSGISFTRFTGFTGHLLTPSPLRGSKWMTGGSVGPEASLITPLEARGVCCWRKSDRDPSCTPRIGRDLV